MLGVQERSGVILIFNLGFNEEMLKPAYWRGGKRTPSNLAV